MKTIVSTSPNIESEGMTVTEMGVSKKRVNKILSHMRDTVYNDLMLAVVREYSCNAIDEHRKHGITKPVEIGIRDTDEGGEVFIRDFALGLSDSGIRDVFAMSGESTKDDSDDDIGGFGIGAKCGLSYSDAFFVHTHFNGVKTIYNFMLGADAAGDPVGQVYDLDRSPTSETGIEVIVPIKTSDKNTFWNRICEFVEISPHNIRGSWEFREIAPAIAAAETKEGKFTIRCVPSRFGYAGKKVIQMGGVTYSSDKLGLDGIKVLEGHALVIDMPIGTCEPALSRETLRKTERTQRAMDEIASLCANLAESDLNQFKTKTVLDLVNDSLAALKSYQGEFFQTYANNLYKSVWGFVESTQIYDRLLPSEQKNSKPICVIIPDNDARQYWITKVKNYLKDSGRNLYFAKEGVWISSQPSIADSFEFISARKLPYPKIQKVNGRFAVYRRTRRRGRVEMIGKLNALELFNYASKEYDWKFEATTEKEASDFLTEKAKKVEDNSGLEQIAVQLQTTGSIISVNSSSFFNKLESLGFVGVGGQKWQEINKKLSEKRELASKKEQTLSSAKKHWVQYSPKTVKAITKVRHAERMGKFWKSILAEKSLRGKILNGFQSHVPSYSSIKIERHELKKILALR